MKVMDIGGGFPAGDIPEKTYKALKLTENDPLKYRVIAEPGRHLCAYSCYLLTKVIGKRVKQGKVCYHINDSIYNTFNNVIIDKVTIDNEN